MVLIPLLGCASLTMFGLFGYQGLSLVGGAILCGIVVKDCCVRPNEPGAPVQYIHGADMFLV